MFNMIAFSLKVSEDIGTASGQMVNKMQSGMTDIGSIGDLMIIPLVMIVIIVFAWFLDTHNIFIAIFGVYTAWLLNLFFPVDAWAKSIEWIGSWWFRMVLATTTIVVISIILSWNRLFRINYRVNFLVRWWQGLVGGIVCSGLFISLILSTFPDSFLTQFSDRALKIFTGETSYFFWFLGSIVGLFFIKNKKRSKKSYQ